MGELLPSGLPDSNPLGGCDSLLSILCVLSSRVGGTVQPKNGSCAGGTHCATGNSGFRVQASPRDAFQVGAIPRGLKPTATVGSSLRDSRMERGAGDPPIELRTLRARNGECGARNGGERGNPKAGGAENRRKAGGRNPSPWACSCLPDSNPARSLRFTRRRGERGVGSRRLARIGLWLYFCWRQCWFSLRFRRCHDAQTRCVLYQTV